MIRVAPATIRGIEIARPKMISLCCLGRRRDGKNIIQAHDNIGDSDGSYRTPQIVRTFDIGLVCFVLDEQLDCDPQQQKPADQLQPRQLEHMLEDDRKEDAQQNGSARAQNNAPEPLARRQSPARQGNDDGIVAR